MIPITHPFGFAQGRLFRKVREKDGAPRPLLEKREKGRTPKLFRSTSKDQPAFFALKRRPAHPRARRM
jgi:hypothetical protein